MTTPRESHQPTINAVETVMARSRLAQRVGSPIEWHERAFDARRSLASDMLVSTGTTILGEMPYEQIDNHIRETTQGDPDALVSMRQARRLFIAARDSIMLGTVQEPPEAIRPVFTLCRSLGEVADTNGHDRVAIKTSLKELDKVSGLTVDVSDLASQSLLSKRIKRHLHTHQLTSQKTSRQAAHEEFHSWRKGFRKVVNAYTVHAVTTGEAADVTFAARGVALNNHYGHISDRKR